MNDPRLTSRLRAIIVFIVLVYFVGLVRDINEPWIGRHDWNGAFFSQLARNLLRYPFEFHHGIPVVAMGANTPAEGEYCFYPRHPPALVWLVGSFFKIGGESEAVARFVPILFSMASLLLLMRVATHAFGWQVGIVSGALYAMMPMTVYFGRMVDHEAVCQCFMLAAMVCWIILVDPTSSNVAKWRACTGWCLFVFATVWVDWPGVLFGAVFLPVVIHSWRSRRIRASHAITLSGSVAFAGLSVAYYLATYGFNGRWKAFADMFLARTKVLRGKPWWETLNWIPGNLTWPLTAAFCVGLIIVAYQVFGRSKVTASSSSASDTPITNGAASTAIGVSAACGLLWVMIFWRQFQIHEYWMFYCGPAIACCTAIGVIGVSAFFAKAHEKRVHIIACLLLVGMAYACYDGQAKKFSAIDFHEEGVRSFKQMAAATQPGQRVVFTWNPITPDGNGDFILRNIVPPQLAYYIDRAFDVETDPAKIRSRVAQGAFVIDFGG